MSRVQILLATYDGARYLPEFLDSLQRQTFSGWRLCVRDDGSSDATLALLRAGVPAAQLQIVEDGRGRLGAKANFGALLEHVDGDALLFADQDDRWLPHKLAILTGRLDALRAAHGDAQPLVAISDCRLIDADGVPLAASLWHYQQLLPAHFRSPLDYCFANPAPGCSMAFNRAAAEIARPLPAQALMHDWWLLLLAACFGQVEYVEDPLVEYRKHGANAIGARHWSWREAFGELLRAPRTPGLRLAAQIVQVRVLLQRHGAMLEPALRRQLQTLAQAPDRSGLVRLAAFARQRLRRAQWSKTALLYAAAATLPHGTGVADGASAAVATKTP